MLEPAANRELREEREARVSRGDRRHGAGVLRLCPGRHHGLAVLCTMGAAAFLLLVMTLFGDRGIFKIRQLARDRAALEERIAVAEREVAALRRRLLDVKEGRFSAELAARERLGLVKPGEVVYDFRGDPLAAGR